MAKIYPFTPYRYSEIAGPLVSLVTQPYDKISPSMKDTYLAQSPYNLVRVILGEYSTAAQLLKEWMEGGILVRDKEPSLFAYFQEFRVPDTGEYLVRKGFIGLGPVEDYSTNVVYRHEQTLSGPKKDRLELLRTTRAHCEQLFMLYQDPQGEIDGILDEVAASEPTCEVADEYSAVHRLWRISDRALIARMQQLMSDKKLLIADGHHRYETARAYAEEVGGDGPHRYVLMCLVALQDPGLTVFPTHRLVRGLKPDQHERLASALRRDFEIEPLADVAGLPPRASDQVQIGYIDAHFRRPYMLRLKDPAIADKALSNHAGPYRRLDTAVLEALILKGALEMTDQDIDHLSGLGYARDEAQALEFVESGEYDAAFFMAPTPIEHVQAVAAAGESMPPKSTYFFPKVPTGLLFNPLAE